MKVFSGHRELLDSGLWDVLVVSTPNMTHYEILMDIINHPKPHHVLVEKPLCTTVAHCKELVIWLRDHLYIELIYYYGLSFYMLYSITNHTVYVRLGSCFGTSCPFVQMRCIKYLNFVQLTIMGLSQIVSLFGG